MASASEVSSSTENSISAEPRISDQKCVVGGLSCGAFYALLGCSMVVVIVMIFWGLILRQRRDAVHESAAESTKGATM